VGVLSHLIVSDLHMHERLFHRDEAEVDVSLGAAEQVRAEQRG
jgi:hypothetical protein